jgi:dTDP-4-amino-4,6-dideoxygalactose transaminase
MSLRIPFNRPCVVGRELEHLAEAAQSGRLSGDGPFTIRCAELLEKRYDIHRILLTPSCSGALDMAADLCGLGPDTEAILPSFTFTSTANSVMRGGAKPVFVDIREDTLNMDESLVEAAVTERTRAIWPVHYAGVGCEMDEIMAIADRHDLLVVEDAAQCMDARYRGKSLGGIGHLGAYSYHETKNVVSGEGGALCVNDPDLLARAEIIREKGTNRAQFFRGEIDKYTWVDVGSSQLASELVAAFLYGQFEQLDFITSHRIAQWDRYHAAFEAAETAGVLRRPKIPEHCEHNAHIYHLLLETGDARNALMDHLRARGILAVFHYIPLHSSPAGQRVGYRADDLPITEDLSARLLRLPLFHDLTEAEQGEVISETLAFLGVS